MQSKDVKIKSLIQSGSEEVLKKVRSVYPNKIPGGCFFCYATGDHDYSGLVLGVTQGARDGDVLFRRKSHVVVAALPGHVRQIFPKKSSWKIMV